MIPPLDLEKHKRHLAAERKLPEEVMTHDRWLRRVYAWINQNMPNALHIYEEDTGDMEPGRIPPPDPFQGIVESTAKNGRPITLDDLRGWRRF